MGRKKQEAEELLAPDPFMEKATSGMNWLEKNLKYVIGALAVVLGGIVATQFFMAEGDRAKSAVTTDLTKAVDAFGEATSLQAVLTSTSPENLKKSYKDVRTQFTSFRSKHGAHPSAKLAAVYEAELARRMGDYAEAETLFDEYIQKSGPKGVLRFMALEGAGYAYESDKKLDESLSRFEQLANEQAFYKDYALKHKARIQEKKGDTADAIATYEALVAMDDPRQDTASGSVVEKTPLKAFAEERLKALK